MRGQAATPGYILPSSTAHAPSMCGAKRVHAECRAKALPPRTPSSFRRTPHLNPQPGRAGA